MTKPKPDTVSVFTLMLLLLLEGCAASLSVQTSETESDDQTVEPMTATDMTYYSDYWISLTLSIPIP